jgi:hypothetical protein
MVPRPAGHAPTRRPPTTAVFARRSRPSATRAIASSAALDRAHDVDAVDRRRAAQREHDLAGMHRERHLDSVP